MFTIACPGCGADVRLRSPASVMAVCGYCQTTVLKEDGAVKAVGKMSAVLDAYTPFQIGVSGVYRGRPFTLVGRIQIRYEDGLWNEWYALFDDGTDGWLSDGSGQYVFTTPDGVATDAPPFEQLQPGSRYRLYTASDVRTATCVAGQGELPFQVGEGWPTRTADFRAGANFLTLDYSEGFPPKRYTGKGLSLDELNCQLLRETDAVADSAGRYQGGASALACPNCGGPLGTVNPLAPHLVCPACHAEVAVTADQASVLKTHAQLSAITTTLQLGDVGHIDGHDYTLIGLLRMQELGEDFETWTEYLLFHPAQGFLWLVETRLGWDRVVVLNERPDVGADSVNYQERTWVKAWEYNARVIYAAGAFNWRVKLNDQTRLTEYKTGIQTLTLEQTATEQTWSHARSVSRAQVAAWFGKTAAAEPPPTPPAADGPGPDGCLIAAIVILLVLFVLYLFLFLNDDSERSWSSGGSSSSSGSSYSGGGWSSGGGHK